MDVQVLGPVEASVDGRSIPLGGGKPRALLAMLALNAGATVSTDRLIDGLWGEQPPASAHKLVQVYVSQLRKALGSSADGAEIVTRRHGYELRVGPDVIDAQRFARLVASGAPREALALWRGPPLDDVADEPFAGAEIRRLEELRLGALESAIDRDLEDGRHREVVGELEALVAAEPLRERLHAQRMLALYRCGRQADALAAYRDARTVLVEAIGVEPGGELRQLHDAILRQDPSLDRPAALELPPELDPGTPLTGRDADVEWLRELWRGARGGVGRLVQVTGPRGIGKTRLAAALGDDVHRDRCAVLYASGAGAPDAALAALARAGAASRPTLLVLDDVDRAGEAVVAALDELAGRLAALPVLVLATAEDAQLRADSTLCLGPLDAAAVRAVAELYAATSDEAAAGTERILRESGGVPQQVHRLAAASARAAAARRLDGFASRAAAERAGLRTAEEEVAGEVVRLDALRERVQRREVKPEPVPCPFKGLASFDVDDAEYFFGRERLVAEMVARLAGAPLIGIVGPSGSGKSSALRAGLLPALAAGVLPGSASWTLALLRPGEHPLRALELAGDEAPAHGPLLIAVDQFEETFTACADETERAEFVEALVAAAHNPRRTRVLIAVRADFYGRCAAYPELARLLGANHVLVGPMNHDELRRAIELPAQRAGLRVEPELVDALIADVEGEPGALPLLSTALLELWQQRDGLKMRLSAYRQSGGVHRAVARLAERAYERLDPEQRETARRILLRLAGEDEGDAAVRRRVQLSELPGERVPDVLAVLADDRLVTIGEGEVEVAHEALLREWPRLRGWLQEDAQGRHLHHQLHGAAREWDARGRDPGELYRGARLAAALEWSGAHEEDLNVAEREFLAASRAAAERSQRRLRAVLAGVAILLVLSVIAGVVALGQRANARDEATAADAQRLGARALVEPELDRSLLLARQGMALDDSVETRGNLLAALVRSPAAAGFLRPSNRAITSVALSPDDRTLAVGDNAGNLIFYDASTRRRLETLEQEVPASATPDDIGTGALAYSPDGERLAVARGGSYRNQSLWLFDTRTRTPVARLQIPSGRAVARLRYVGDGRTLVAVLAHLTDEWERSELVTFAARTGRRLRAPTAVGPARLSASVKFADSPVSVSSDGRRLVFEGSRETIVRDADDLRILQRFPAEVGEVSASELGPDDRTFAIGGRDGSLYLLDLRSGELRTASGPRGAAVERIAFSPDGHTLVTGDIEGGIIRWDVRRAEAVETLPGHRGTVRGFAVTSDGDTLYSGSLDRGVIEWDLAGSRRLGRPFRAGPGDNVNNPRYALSSDGRVLAYGQDSGEVSIVDTRTLASRKPIRLATRIGGIAFMPASHLLVAGDSEGSLALVDTDSGEIRWHVPAHRANINTPSASADGRLIVTYSPDGSVRFWSAADGGQIGRPLIPREFPYEAQLSPDGRVVALALGSRLELIDAHSRRLIRAIKIGDGLNTARFSPDGRLLAVANQDGVRVLSTSNWTPVTRWFSGHPGGMWWVMISKDDRTLVTSGYDGTVRLWDIDSEQAVGTPLPGLPGHPVTGLLTPDGNAVIAGYDTGLAYRWDIRPESLARQACRIAGRTLTRAEWDEFLPRREYDPACTD